MADPVAESGALRSQGTKIQHGILAVFADFEEATDIKIGGASVSSIDVTHLQSVAKEFVAGLKDNGTIDISASFTNGVVQNAVRSDFDLGKKSPYKIVIPAGASTITFAFNAIVTKYDGPEAGVDKKLAISVSLKISGALTITTA